MTQREIPPEPDEFRLLEKVVKKHGLVYTQLKRTASCALYSVSNGGFELLKIRIAPATFMKITWTWVPEREVYPSDEEFGVRGWYFMPQEASNAESRWLKLLIESGEAD